MITKSQQFAKTSPTLSLLVGFSLKIDKKQPQGPQKYSPLSSANKKDSLPKILPLLMRISLISTDSLMSR